MPRTSRSDQLAEFLQGGLKQGAASVQSGFETANKRQLSASQAQATAAKDDLDRRLKESQLESLNEERINRATSQLEGRSSQAGTAQVVPALQRGNTAIPGLFGDDPNAQPEYKSVGGFKTLLPNIAVAPLEALGLLDKGATAERNALQELQNVKIYDSSGKAINEAESKRLSDSMGLRGITNPEEITAALRQMGYTALEKQKGVTAGARPEAVSRFKGRGGLVGATTLQELIKGTAQSGVESKQPAGNSPNALRDAAQAEIARRRGGQ